MFAVFESVDCVFFWKAIHPLMGYGVPLVADETVNIHLRECRDRLVPRLIARIGVRVNKHVFHDLPGHFISRLSELWEMALSANHEMFDLHILRLLHAGILPTHETNGDCGLDGGCSPSAAEDGPGVDRFLPVVIDIFMTFLALR